MSHYEKSIVFTKMHVCGNDFCLVNGIRNTCSLTPTAIRHLGDRYTGIGFDQFILLERPLDSKSDITVKFFNRDGSAAGQCGNGCSAVAAFLNKHQLIQERIVRLAICNQITECEIITSKSNFEYTVEVNLGSPKLDPKYVPFHADSQQLQYRLEVPSLKEPLNVSVLSLGNPHAVFLVPRLDDELFDEIAPEIQQHPSFPESTNVEMLEIQNDSQGKIRIFERGVGETRASGTGAAAAAIIGQLLNLFTGTVTIMMPGGSVLVRWEGEKSSVFISCNPIFTFTGTIPVSNLM